MSVHGDSFGSLHSLTRLFPPQGNSVRTVGATRMNAESSRSHAIFTITLTQQTKLTNRMSEKAMISRDITRDLSRDVESAKARASRTSHALPWREPRCLSVTW